MKKLFTSLCVLSLTLVLLQITSCKKADPIPVNYSIQGLWTGTYSVNGDVGSGAQYYSLAIKPDGSLLVDSKNAGQQYLATGTWTLNGNAFTGSFSYVYGLPTGVATSQSIMATWDSSTGTLTSGTWKNTVPANGFAGTFTLTKPN